MSLEKRVGEHWPERRVLPTWNPDMAAKCWKQFSTNYDSPQHHQYELFKSFLSGTTNEYNDKKCKVFARYARLYHYVFWRNYDVRRPL